MDEGEEDGLLQAPHTRLEPHHTPHPKTREHPHYQFKYFDVIGENVLFVMAEYGNGERLPWIWGGTEWLQQPPKRPAPLFGLPELAALPAAPVCIVESERSAKRARGLMPNQAWVSWPGLGFSPRALDLTPFKGRRVIIWPNANLAGKEVAIRLGAVLEDTAKSVEWVRSWEGYHDGWALQDADGQSAGHTGADLIAFAKAHKGPIPKPGEVLEPPTMPPERRSANPLPDPTDYMPPEASYELPEGFRYLNGHTAEHSIAIITPADTIPVTAIEWLWPGVAPVGKPTLFVGDPGLFKSGLTVDVAARVSRGDAWPLGLPNTIGPAEVLIASAEDDPSDTIIPRLNAAGADISKISFIEGVKSHDEEGKEKISSLALDRHLEQVEHVAAARQGRLKLLIVDPISAFLGKTDSHKNSDVRAVITGLAAIAAKYRFATIIVSHLNKGSSGGAIYRVSGSLAFVAAARAVFAIVRDPEAPDRRLMLPVKNNLAADTTGLAFTIKVADNDAPRLEWDAEPVSEYTADAVMGNPAANAPEGDNITAAVMKVADWLKEVLGHEAQPIAVIWRGAEERKFRRTDVYRAKKYLGIEAANKGYQGQWHWILPGKEAAARAD